MITYFAHFVILLSLILVIVKAELKTEETVACLGSQTVAEYIEEAFMHHTQLLRRGVPNDQVQPSFTKLLEKTVKMVKTKRNLDDNLAEKCVDEKMKNGLKDASFKAVKLQKKIEKQVKKQVRKGEKRYFFLSTTEVPELPPLPDGPKKACDDAWAACLDSLKAPLRSFDSSRCVLPPVLSMFYDPHEQLQQRWVASFMMNQNREFWIPCYEFFYEAMAIVVRLKVLEACTDEQAEQIMLHALAFIFKFIRTTRIECVNLKVPKVHLLQYNDKYNQLTVGMALEALSDAQLIQAKDMAFVMEESARHILTFSARGMPSYVTISESDVVGGVDVWTDLVGTAQIGYFRNMMGIRSQTKKLRDAYLGDSSTLSAWLSSLFGPVERVRKASARLSAWEQCETPAYWWYRNGVTGAQQCCGALCLEVEYGVRSVPGFTTQDCCKICNKQVSCYELESDARYYDITLGVTNEDYSDNYGSDTTMIVL